MYKHFNLPVAIKQWRKFEASFMCGTSTASYKTNTLVKWHGSKKRSTKSLWIDKFSLSVTVPAPHWAMTPSLEQTNTLLCEMFSGQSVTQKLDTARSLTTKLIEVTVLSDWQNPAAAAVASSSLCVYRFGALCWQSQDRAMLTYYRLYYSIWRVFQYR